MLYILRWPINFLVHIIVWAISPFLQSQGILRSLHQKSDFCVCKHLKGQIPRHREEKKIYLSIY